MVGLKYRKSSITDGYCYIIYIIICTSLSQFLISNSLKKELGFQLYFEILISLTFSHFSNSLYRFFFKPISKLKLFLDSAQPKYQYQLGTRLTTLKTEIESPLLQLGTISQQSPVNISQYKLLIPRQDYNSIYSWFSDRKQIVPLVFCLLGI